MLCTNGLKTYLFTILTFSRYGHFEVTELLIRHSANVGALDLWQFSPLHEAASKGRTEVCSLLLSHGADPTTVNCHGKSAIDVAATQELKDSLLLEFKGHTLLEACRQGDPQKVKKALLPEIINQSAPMVNHIHTTKQNKPDISTNSKKIFTLI